MSNVTKGVHRFALTFAVVFISVLRIIITNFFETSCAFKNFFYIQIEFWNHRNENFT